MDSRLRIAGAAGGSGDGPPAFGRGRWSRGLSAVAAAAALAAGLRVEAQDDVKNFRKPILVVETEGHHAPIHSLIWRNAFSLLSAGRDKVVKCWDLGDGARLARTIRPMIWRGPSGVIYAMALSPKPDERGESYLAVGGVGILSHGGDITVYRYPGGNREGTGEPVARLFGPGARDPGHRNHVLCLAFDPSGRILASGDADRTVILWERAGGGFRHLRTFAAHDGAVRALAFTPDGTRLITAGGSKIDGSVRAWDVASGAQVGIFPGTTPPAEVNALAIHPDGQSAVIGREDGALLRLDLRNLALAPERLATLEKQGPVEHVAFSPDGSRLALSVIADGQGARLDPKSISCDVEIRQMPGGAVLHRHAGIPGIVYAAAFSPDGGRLAYAGGHAQAIFIRDARDPRNRPTELKGQGTSIMSVGFTADSRTVGFTRELAPPPGPVDGFDLNARAYRPVGREELGGPILQHDGWTLAINLTRTTYQLRATHADGRSANFPVNQIREGNFWSYTIVPGNAERGHPRPTVAVGTREGVIVFDLQTGARTRMFAGHSAAILALAPSPDGRWLASGSMDQTIRIYPLAGCDTLPAFGATFRQAADSSWVVDRVEPRSFAAGSGLLAGDRVLRGQVIDALLDSPSGRMDYSKPDEIAGFVRRIEAAIPNDRIGLLVSRTLWIPGVGHVPNVELPGFASSKRNNPSLNLMVSLDKEWILWTPRGYYDTSIEGDSRLLGWQINPPFNPTIIQAPRPTEYLPIASFATKLIRGDILDRVWNSAGTEGEPNVAVAVRPVAGPNPPPAAPPPAAPEPLPEKIVVEEQPPRIEFASLVAGSPLPGPGETWSVSAANPRIRVRISAAGKLKVKDRQVVIDDRLVSTSLDAEAVSLGEEFAVPTPPNRPVRVLVKATNVLDNPRSAWLDIVYTPPAPVEPLPPTRSPRLVMIGIGIDEFQNPGLPKLEFASADAKLMTDFLPQHLTTPSGAVAAPGSAQDRIVLLGAAATAKGIGDTFDPLRDQVQKKQLGAGDMVAVFLDSHVLEVAGPDGKKTTVVAPSDLGAGNPPAAPGVSTRDLSERLGELADAGCRVVLFLDGVHLPSSGKGTLRSNIKPWVRELQKDRRVITFVASKNGPSRLSESQRQGLFALGLLQAFRGAQPTGTLSIDAFKTAVVEEVRNLSNRYQEVGLFLPDSVPPRTRFARP